MPFLPAILIWGTQFKMKPKRGDLCLPSTTKSALSPSFTASGSAALASPGSACGGDLEEGAERFAAVTVTAEPASPEEIARAEVNAARRTWQNINRVRARLVDELVAANGDWDRIDEICVVADWSPRDAMSIALTRDRALAERMLVGWLERRGNAR